MVDFVQRISALSPAKLELLKACLRKSGDTEVRAQIPVLPRGSQVFPLSFAQERLWFLDQFQPGSPMYHIPQAYRFTGPLNVLALEQSLDEIMRRHEVLRMSIAVVDGQPMQVIDAQHSLKLLQVDLRQMEMPMRDMEMQRLAAEEAAAPFDLSQGPLVRATLLELHDADHVLLVTMHHIVSDGWSMGVFSRELTQLYDAYSAGRPSPLPELCRAVFNLISFVYLE